MRGGWHPDGSNAQWPHFWNSNDGNWTHDGFQYWILWGLPLGTFAACASQGKQCLFIFLLISLSSGFGIYVGWQNYFTIGRDVDSSSPSGAFDWLIGRAQPDWIQSRKFLHDLCGMTLRGLVQTAPSGLFLFMNGFHWTYLGSGLFMGLVYNLGFSITFDSVNFSAPGAPMAEFLWGSFTVLALVLPILAVKRYFI
jgi:hypothetical protein